MKALLIIIGFIAFVAGTMIASIKSTSQGGRAWFGRSEDADNEQRLLERRSGIIGVGLCAAGIMLAAFGFSL